MNIFSGGYEDNTSKYQTVNNTIEPLVQKGRSMFCACPLYKEMYPLDVTKRNILYVLYNTAGRNKHIRNMPSFFIAGNIFKLFFLFFGHIL
jgi:hypothetical protein